MPRSGSGIYTQPFPNVIEDTTIESAVYNGFTRDVEADLNLPRPIVAGGTGGSSAAEAADNLNVLPLSGGTLTGDLEIKPGNLTIENDNPILSIAKKLSGQAVAVFGKLLTAGRWRIVLGDGAAETGANTGSDFHLENYDDAGSMLGIVMHVSRRTNVTTLTGAASPDTPILVLNKLANGAPAALRGSWNGTARWQVVLGDGIVEEGSNSGSDFRINRYSDTGTLLGVPFGIWRNSGVAFVSAAPFDQGPVFIVNKISGAGTQSAMIWGTTANIARWGLALGDGSAEAPGNVGSNFKLNRYDSSGAFLNYSIVVERSTNIFAVTGAALKPGGGSWGDTSDARIKTVTGDYTQGLEAVRQLRPVTYKFKGTDVTYTPEGAKKSVPKGKPDPESVHYMAATEGREFIGLLAQQAERSMPEMVKSVSGTIDGHAVNDLRVMDTTPLVFALVNACKELAERVEALEARRM